MSDPLPGEHYCEEHQGNHSHYAATNCTVCKLHIALVEVRRLLDHSARICDCPSCEQIKAKYKMRKSCRFEHFQLP